MENKQRLFDKLVRQGAIKTAAMYHRSVKVKNAWTMLAFALMEMGKFRFIHRTKHGK